MLKKALSLFTVIILISVMLVGCSKTEEFNKIAKFKLDDIEEVSVIMALGEETGIKYLSQTQIKELWEAISVAELKKNKELDKNAEVFYHIDFKIKGNDGYFRFSVGMGSQGIGGYNGKFKSGFYQFIEQQMVLNLLNKFYYRPLADSIA